MSYELVPSILGVPKKKTAEYMPILEQSCSKIQIDVMDGKFVPHKHFGPQFTKNLQTDLEKEVHLMIEHPEIKFKNYLGLAESIVVHIEAVDTTQIPKMHMLCHLAKAQFGLAISPQTSLTKLKPYLPFCDRVIIMTVHPGKGGQKLIPQCLTKVKQLRKNFAKPIQVDGGINAETIIQAKAAGANEFIVGSALFKGESVENNLRNFKRLIRKR